MMKLSEIVIISGTLTSSGIDVDAFRKQKNIGTLDELTITLSQSQVNKHIKKISLVKDGSDIATVVGYFFKHLKTGRTFFHFQRSWTEPSYRNQGWMTKLRQFLKDTWNISFLSDRCLTLDGLNMWRRIKTSWNVKIFDAMTGDVIPWTIGNEKNIFVPVDEYDDYSNFANHHRRQNADRYYLISESFDIFNTSSVYGMPGIPSWILTPPST